MNFCDSSDDELEPTFERKPSLHRKTTSGRRKRKVGCYVIGETLGKGSYGVVKLGIKEDTSETFALKFLSKKEVTDVDEVERLFRESAILTSLKCEHIIHLHEVIDDGSHIVMVMEYCPGGELFDHISTRTALSEREACRIFHEIVTGVEYCHRKNVVHRDLKLENILLSAIDGKVKIADFGLSNTSIVGRSMGTACGTPSYLAPEQIERGNHTVGSPADLWSMGVILYAMVAGFLPYDAKGTPALFKKILSRDHTFPDYFSVELRDLVDRLLTLDPEKRATTSEIKSHPWYLMEVTDLAVSLERQVTPAEVKRARAKVRQEGRRKNKTSTSSTSSAKLSTTSTQSLGVELVTSSTMSDMNSLECPSNRTARRQQHSMSSFPELTKRPHNRSPSAAVSGSRAGPSTPTNARRSINTAGQFKMRTRLSRAVTPDQSFSASGGGGSGSNSKRSLSRNRSYKGNDPFLSPLSEEAQEAAKRVGHMIDSAGGAGDGAGPLPSSSPSTPKLKRKTHKRSSSTIPMKTL